MTPNRCLDTSSRQRADLPQGLLSPDRPADEHVAVLRELHDYDLLRRKDDLFDEGVAAVFGIKHGEAEVQAICFDSNRFNADQARAWLLEWGFAPRRFQAADDGKN